MRLKKYKYIIALLALNLIVFHRWFIFKILSYGDFLFYYSNTLKEWVNIPLIWGSNGIGIISLSITYWPVFFLYGLVGAVGFDSNIADKLLLFLPIAIILPISSYVLIKRVTNSHVGAFVGSLVYAFNTAFLLLNMGILHLTISFALAPIILYFLIKMLEEKSFYYAVLIGCVSFVASSYEARGFYIIAWIILLYFIYHSLFIERASLKKFFQNGALTLVIFGIVMLLNLYWILGIQSVGDISSTGAVGRELFGVGYMNIDKATTLFHPFWTGGSPSLFKVQPIPLYFWLIPVVAFLGEFFNRKNKLIIFFGLVSLLGILLAKQESAPFPSLYEWLYNTVPGFNAFREASKFYSLIALGYSVLIGSFVAWLWESKSKLKILRYVKYIAISAIALLFLFNTKPLITGESQALFVPRQIPNDYVLLKNYIDEQDDFFRTYWVPRASRWGVFSNQHPKIHGVEIFDTVLHDIPREKGSTMAETILMIFNASYGNDFLDSASVKYVVVPVQDKENDDDFFINYGKDKNYYVETLDKIEFLKRIDIGTKDLVVYENQDFKPHIYSSETLSKMEALNEVDFEMINPTKKILHIKGATKSFYLKMNDAYNPDWRAVFVKDTNTRFFPFVRQNRIPDDSHQKLNNLFNAWYVDINDFCNIQKLCQKNSDGSYNIEMTIEFWPQRYVNLGFVISMLTLALITSFLIYRYLKR